MTMELSTPGLNPGLCGEDAQHLWHDHLILFLADRPFWLLCFFSLSWFPHTLCYLFLTNRMFQLLAFENKVLFHETIKTEGILMVTTFSSLLPVGIVLSTFFMHNLALKSFYLFGYNVQNIALLCS